MDENIRTPHRAGERKPNPLLLGLDYMNEFLELDLGDDYTETEKIYSYNLLHEVRITFYLTRSAYETLKKYLFKKIYQLSKTITNINENQDNYCEKIWKIIQEHELFYEECMRNPNLFSIPFVYGIELLFKRFNYEYKLPSGDMSSENSTKFKNILKKIRLFLKLIRGTPANPAIGAGLIFRICISIIENLDIHYATGGQPTVYTIIRHTEVLSVFDIEIIARNRSKRKTITGFESKKELKKLRKK